MIRGIAHLAFNVMDMEKSLHFYCDILSFKKVFEINDDRNRPWIVYIQVSDNQYLELFYTRNEEIQSRPVVGYSHLCLEVDDIYTIAKIMEENDVHLDVLPMQGKDKNYQCWVQDPDGNKIEFMQMVPHAPELKS